MHAAAGGAVACDATGARRGDPNHSGRSGLPRFRQLLPAPPRAPDHRFGRLRSRCADRSGKCGAVGSVFCQQARVAGRRSLASCPPPCPRRLPFARGQLQVRPSRAARGAVRRDRRRTIGLLHVRPGRLCHLQGSAHRLLPQSRLAARIVRQLRRCDGSPGRMARGSAARRRQRFPHSEAKGPPQCTWGLHAAFPGAGSAHEIAFDGSKHSPRRRAARLPAHSWPGRDTDGIALRRAGPRQGWTHRARAAAGRTLRHRPRPSRNVLGGLVCERGSRARSPERPLRCHCRRRALDGRGHGNSSRRKASRCRVRSCSLCALALARWLGRALVCLPVQSCHHEMVRQLVRILRTRSMGHEGPAAARPDRAGDQERRQLPGRHRGSAGEPGAGASLACPTGEG